VPITLEQFAAECRTILKFEPGKARPVRTYKLTPGTAYVYNEGELHSPRRRGPTQLIRIEGVNMDRVERARFEPV